MNLQDEISKKINRKYSKKELREAIPLIIVKLNKKKEEKTVSDVVLFTDRFKDELFDSKYVIGDIYGNIHTKEAMFLYIKKCGDNDFLIIRFNENEKEIKHFRYDKEKQELTEEFDLANYSISFPIKGRPDLAILNNDGKFSLYSFKEKRIISPEFDTLSVSSNENDRIFFQFTDTVESNLEETITTENGSEVAKRKTRILGFISEDGVMCDSVFDEYSNKTICWDLNSDNEFRQYSVLKNTISISLDQEIEDKYLKQTETKLSKINSHN